MGWTKANRQVFIIISGLLAVITVIPFFYVVIISFGKNVIDTGAFAITG